MPDIDINTIEAFGLVQLIEEMTPLVKLNQIPRVSSDPRDHIFLACVGVSKSDYLVSGDPDLLDIKTYGRAQIVTPAEFLAVP